MRRFAALSKTESTRQPEFARSNFFRRITRRKPIAHLLPDWVVYVIYLIVLLLEFTPILWLVSMSFKQPSEYFTSPVRWIPSEPTLEHYIGVFTSLKFGQFFINSVVITAGTTLICILFSTLGAYSIARFQTGGPVLLMSILIQRMIPGIVLVISLYLFFARLQQLDTLPALIFTYVGINLPFTIWLLCNYFAEVPLELEEAAQLDGCNRFGAFWRVSLPLAMSGIVATAVLVAIGTWNEFFISLILTNTPKAQTLPVAISTLIVPTIEIKWGEMSAAAVMALVPVFIFALLVQRRLVQGLTGGAVKG